MITEKQYLKAQEIIDKYKSEQLNKHTAIRFVVVRDDCPDGYWYSNQYRSQFNVKACHYSDLHDVEGFSDKEPNECWKVTGGEFAGNLIEKQHCE